MAGKMAGRRRRVQGAKDRRGRKSIGTAAGRMMFLERGEERRGSRQSFWVARGRPDLPVAVDRGVELAAVVEGTGVVHCATPRGDMGRTQSAVDARFRWFADFGGNPTSWK